MNRDVTRLRNIGILTSVDAGNVTCRNTLFQLIGGRTIEGGEHPAGPLVGRDALPASAGSWTPRSGPFADEPMELTFVTPAARVLDGALVVLDGARGVVETADAALRNVCARRLPCVVFIDEVGRPEDLEAMVAALELDSGMTAVPVQLPWNDGRGSHVVDVLDQRLVVGPDTEERELRPIPPELEETVGRIRRRIVDICAEVDERIYGASVAGLGIGGDELARALRKAMFARDARMLVVTCGSLRARRGAGLLLDALVTYLPSPADRPPVFGLDPRRAVTVARFAREDAALAATVFATSNVPVLGELTWVRIHSGTMDVSATINVLPRDSRGRIERIFLPHVRGLLEVNTAGPGQVVCVTGVADACVGDTIACVRAPVVLDEVHAPRRAPAAAAVDGVAPPHTSTIWSVARSLQSVPASNTGLRRSRS